MVSVSALMCVDTEKTNGSVTAKQQDNISVNVINKQQQKDNIVDSNAAVKSA